MRSSKERHLALLAVEARLYPSDWYLQGLDTRPLLRRTLWQADSLRSDPSRINHLPNRLFQKARTIFERGNSSPTSHERDLWWRCDSSLEMRQVDSAGSHNPFGVFATPRNLRHTLFGLGEIDRVYSSFGLRLEHPTLRLEIPALTHFLRSQSRPVHLPHTHVQALTSAIRSIGSEFVSSDPQLMNQVVSRFFDSLQDLMVAREFGRTLIAQTPTIKYLVTAAWYHPTIMGLCAAFSERGLPVIDVQHGQQGEFQSMYVDWSVQQTPSVSLLPSTFWVWGDLTRERIDSPNRTDAPTARIVGYPFVNDLATLSTGRPRRSSHVPSASQPKIVIALQRPHIDIPHPIPDPLINYIRRTNATFFIREHPNGPLASSERKSLSHSASGDIYFVDGNEPLPVTLDDAKLLITGFSSAVLEAAMLKIPSIVWSPIAANHYKDLISNGVVAFDPHLKTSPHQVINSTSAPRWEALHRYVNQSPTTFFSAVESLEHLAQQ